MQEKDSKTTQAKNRKRRAGSAAKLSAIVKPPRMSLTEWQVGLRKQMALHETYTIHPVDERSLPGEYAVANASTRQQYKVVYRGQGSEWNYCSCMDFKTSQLGTCKHIEAVKLWIEKTKRQHVHRELPPYSSIYLSYTDGRKVKMRIGTDHRREFERLATHFLDDDLVLPVENYSRFGELIMEARKIDDTFRFYPDAMEYVLEVRERDIRKQVARTYADSDIDALLTVSLYPYQREGVRFAFEKGKAVIADEMGLGKTIQAIATAEMLRKERLVESVLILCPTSLKYQWKREIERFTNAEAHVIEGHHLLRVKQYECDKPYKIISYNSACNDIKVLGSLETDMLIMDEVQRLKNWNTQISKAARRIKAHYSVILSGTPLENRLEELYSVMEFVDQYCLSPFYQFKADYIMTNETGKVVGYQNLNEIGQRITGRLIRRTKKQVALQMPGRQDKNLLVPMTKEQMAIHEELEFKVCLIVEKWNRLHFISEAERMRLLKLLSQMRMVCDSTYILDQETRHDTKVDEVMNILADIFENSDTEKVVIFSQWERMTRLIARELEQRGVGYVNLNGSVPSKKRKEIIDDFTDDPECRVFLSTDAGSTGLNLQVASTLINIDLPWNPAVLEQRIARIYRIGQLRNIQVINLVAHHSFEEKMLDKLKFKTAMFEGVLDNGEDAIFIGDQSKLKAMMDDLSQMMEEGKDDDEVVDDATEEAAMPPTDAPLQDEEAADTPDLPSDENTEDNPIPRNEWGDRDEERETAPSQPTAASKSEEETSEKQPEAGETPGTPARKETSQQTPSQTRRQGDGGATEQSPKALVEQGVSFLSGLARTLQSPEETERLVDAIVQTDEKGETVLRIPVADKQVVKSVLGMLGKLFG